MGGEAAAGVVRWRRRKLTNFDPQIVTPVIIDTKNINTTSGRLMQNVFTIEPSHRPSSGHRTKKDKKAKDKKCAKNDEENPAIIVTIIQT